jgi:hypothetical protein
LSVCIAVALRIRRIRQWQPWTNTVLTVPFRTRLHAWPHARSPARVGQVPLAARSSAPLQFQSKSPQAFRIVKYASRPGARPDRYRSNRRPPR